MGTDFSARNVEQHVNFDKYLFGPELLRDTAPGSVTSFDLGNHYCA